MRESISSCSLISFYLSLLMDLILVPMHASTGSLLLLLVGLIHSNTLRIFIYPQKAYATLYVFYLFAFCYC